MSTLSAERCVACRRDSPRVTEIRGLRNDFIVAAKIDALAAESGHIPRDEVQAKGGP